MADVWSTPPTEDEQKSVWDAPPTEEEMSAPVPISREPGDMAARGPPTEEDVEAAKATLREKMQGGNLAALRSIAQVGSFGIADEATAKLGSAMTRLPLIGKYMDVPISEWGSGKTNPVRSEAEILASTRAANKKSDDDYPAESMLGTVGGALASPGAGAAKAGHWALRLGATGLKNAGLGGLMGFGSSEASLDDNPGQVLKDTGKAAGFGLGASALAWTSGAMGQKILAAAKNGSATAIALAKELTLRAAQKANKTVDAVKNSATAAGSHGIKMVEEVVENAAGTHGDDVVQKAIAKRGSEKALELERKVGENSVDYLDDKLTKLDAATLAQQEARKMFDPEALAAAEEAMLANPITKQLWPRIKKQIIDRGLAAGIGTTVGAAAGQVLPEGEAGKWIGGGLGGVGGAVGGALLGGKASTAWEKMMATPSMKKMLWEWLQKSTEGAQKLGRPVEKLIPLGAAKAGSSGK